MVMYANSVKPCVLIVAALSGPQGDVDTAQKCQGLDMLFGDRLRCPFATSKDLFEHMNEASHPKFDGSQSPALLTHGDLSMRNIIVGHDSGGLEWSRFYPSWFEYIVMVSTVFNDNTPTTWMDSGKRLFDLQEENNNDWVQVLNICTWLNVNVL